MASLQQGQLITYGIDQLVETVSNNCPMARRVSNYVPPAASMQRSSNEFWLPLEQQTELFDGWDASGKSGSLLELSVKGSLGVPKNDMFTLYPDQIRDETTYRRRIDATAKEFANQIEMSIAQQAVDMSTLIVSSPDDIGAADLSGWDFVASAEEFAFNREINRSSGMSFFFNGTDYRKAGNTVIQGSNLYGEIPERAYKEGSVGMQVAGFNEVLRSPKMPTLAGSTVTGVTCTGAQKFKPAAWKLDVDGNKVNVDNRTCTIVVSDSSGFKRGDKIKIAGIKYLAQMAKNVLTEDATLTVVGVEDGTHLVVSPKLVALDDDTLTPEERSYSNVNTSIAAGAAISLINVNTTATNVFWADDSITLVSQPIPLSHELFSGMKAEAFSIPAVGVEGVIAFQGDITTFGGNCRIAFWYSAVAKRPEGIGLGLARQTAA